MTECPVCGYESSRLWRCDECGKPFDASSDKAGRDQGVQR